MTASKLDSSQNLVQAADQAFDAAKQPGTLGGRAVADLEASTILVAIMTMATEEQMASLKERLNAVFDKHGVSLARTIDVAQGKTSQSIEHAAGVIASSFYDGGRTVPKAILNHNVQASIQMLEAPLGLQMQPQALRRLSSASATVLDALRASRSGNNSVEINQALDEHIELLIGVQQRATELLGRTSSQNRPVAGDWMKGAFEP